MVLAPVAKAVLPELTATNAPLVTMGRSAKNVNVAAYNVMMASKMMALATPAQRALPALIAMNAYPGILGVTATL
jgi:hypothetical protein